MNNRLRQCEQSPKWDELKAYLQYVTKEIFGERNQIVGVQYVANAKTSTGTGTAICNGVWITFPFYETTYPCDSDKTNPGAVVRFMLGKDNDAEVSPRSKKIFWYGNIFTRPRIKYAGGYNYSIAGGVDELHYLASDKDPEGFKAAQEWAQQKKKAADEARGVQ